MNCLVMYFFNSYDLNWCVDFVFIVFITVFNKKCKHPSKPFYTEQGKQSYIRVLRILRWKYLLFCVLTDFFFIFTSCWDFKTCTRRSSFYNFKIIQHRWDTNKWYIFLICVNFVNHVIRGQLNLSFNRIKLQKI